jgi:hypothetical protein
MNVALFSGGAPSSSDSPEDGGSTDLWNVSRLYRTTRRYNPHDSHLETLWSSTSLRVFGENCMVRSFIISTFHQILFGKKTENEMDWARSTHMIDENFT